MSSPSAADLPPAAARQTAAGAPESDGARGHPAQPSSVEPVRRAGLLVRALTRATHLSVAVAGLPLRAARPLIMSRPLRPARDAVDALLRTLVDAFASIVAEQLQYNDEVQALVNSVADRMLRDLATSDLTALLVRVQARQFIGYLAANPGAAKELVEVIATQYIEGLHQHPTALRPLVRSLADDYLAALAEQPERVDALVQAAALQFMATLRERPALADGLVRALADRYVASLAERPELLAQLVEGVADGYIVYLQEQPELLDLLVQRTGDRLLDNLQKKPGALQELVQVVGDRYLEHLHSNPDNVQELLAGQSVNLATEIVEEVRTRSSVADNALETVVRNLFGRKPRSELAPPPAPEGS